MLLSNDSVEKGEGDKGTSPLLLLGSIIGAVSLAVFAISKNDDDGDGDEDEPYRDLTDREKLLKLAHEVQALREQVVTPTDEMTTSELADILSNNIELLELISIKSKEISLLAGELSGETND